MEFRKRYNIINMIGSGGMGTIYKAKDKITGQYVALKKLEQVSSPIILKRFKREIISMSLIQHKKVVKILDYELDEEKAIVLELVNGVDLDNMIKTRDKIPPEEAVDYIKQTLSALSFVYINKILHQDLKPGNIMVTYSGEVKICDFGLSGPITEPLNSGDEKHGVGTTYYFAPERYAGEAATVQSEIFSLGVILFEMLAGHKPFEEFKLWDNVDVAKNEIRKKINQMALPSLVNKNSNISQALENVVIKATAKRPEERYNDFDEMLVDLQTVFSKKREDEDKIQVTQVYRHSFVLDKSIDFRLKNKFTLPIHTIIFVVLFFMLLIGVYIYVV